jgi:hypothetical protein
MILHRLTQHVKGQNWTAIGLEFLIVVLGVFLGLQASNWNDAARGRAKEAIILEQLAGEFTSAVEASKEAKTAGEIYMEANREVLRIILNGKEPEDRAAFLQVLRHASSFASGPYEPVTLVELLSSGGLSELSSPGLRTALVQYHETSTTQLEMSNLVLDRISTPHDGFHEAVQINPGFSRESGRNPVFDYDWNLIPATRQQFQVLLYGKTGLQAGIDQQITRGETVLAEIEKARK